MSAYRENAEQLEPTARCSGCGEPVDGLGPDHLRWHVCRLSGDALEAVALSFGVLRPIVGYDEHLRVPILGSDEELRRIVLASLKGEAW